MSLRNY